MNCKNRIVTSEYVAHGHPDKLADFIADSILQEIYFQDRNARTGIEVMVKDNTVVLGGEITTTAKVDYETVVRSVFNHVVYPDNHHLTPDNIKIINLIGEQSPEISAMVDKKNGVIGAGDQGFAVGYASNETPSYLPLGVYVAKTICQRVAGTKYPTRTFGPDAKTQVVVEYDDKGEPHIVHILVSVLHTNYSLENTCKYVMEIITNNDKHWMNEEVYDKYFRNGDIIIEINPYGEWKTGGPIADCGVTGRKIVVDQYGGYANVGGGSFAGKDMSKVDRSAAYMARYIAKNIVASGVCNEAKVELSYIIGQAKPCAVNIEMDDNCDLVHHIKRFFREKLDLSPNGIIDYFGKDNMKFSWYAKYGAFGYTDEEMKLCPFTPWEYTDLSEDLYCYLEGED